MINHIKEAVHADMHELSCLHVHAEPFPLMVSDHTLFLLVSTTFHRVYAWQVCFAKPPPIEKLAPKIYFL